MMFTATRVEAEPIGVKLPSRLAPKITDHHKGDSPDTPNSGADRILDSITARGMLSVTLPSLKKADDAEAFLEQLRGELLNQLDHRWEPNRLDPDSIHRRMLQSCELFAAPIEIAAQIADLVLDSVLTRGESLDFHE